MITELEHARYDAKLLLTLIDEHCISPMHERVLFYFSGLHHEPIGLRNVTLQEQPYGAPFQLSIDADDNSTYVSCFDGYIIIP